MTTESGTGEDANGALGTTGPEAVTAQAATAEGAAPPKAGRREWIGLAVLALPTLLLSMDLSVLYLAVPHLSADLAPSGAQLLWIMDIYGFLMAGFLVMMGTLGDRIGRRRLLLAGACAFGAASALAAFSTSPEMLIVTRALLGIAGATLAPSTLALLRTMFHDPKQRTAAIGVWTVCFSAGSVLGPLAGGALLAHFWWGSVFLLGIPVMLLLLVAGPMLLPEHRNPGAGRIDFVSAVMSVVAVLAVIYGMKDIATHGLGAASTLSIVGGLAVGAAFVVRQRRLDDPLLDLGLFSTPRFGPALGIMGLAVLVMSGTLFFVAQYLQLVRGLSPLEAGLWMVPMALGVVAGAITTGNVIKKVRPPVIMGSGLLVSCGAFALLSQMSVDSPIALFVAGVFCMSFGVSPVMILGLELAVGSAPPERAGAASSVAETIQEFALGLGVAVIGSIGTAVYRSELKGELPADVPADAARAAEDTLGGAVHSAADLADGTGDTLLSLARSAFTEGLQTAATLCAVLVVLGSLVAFTVLRGMGGPGGHQDQDGAEKAEAAP
ncbi:MFS transporter [Streptomyces globisporus]|uniref:MFS transporter n=1 Tax=Streptomyces globisporus TaxID=1908 RepID=UPI000E2D41F4|nr:MFS transporter [Streptomyces sp. HB202]RDL08468.1 DHA2 family multidrug resistance protein-like MFS transporter [Streptomyces sp. HB202]WSF76298.1 MFS transporter [Streptomyces globisporus]WSU80763.1 MFS transporter [Streptomyces globisporus]